MELQMLIYSTPPVFSARFEVLAEDNYDGPYQVSTLDTCSSSSSSSDGPPFTA
jgi:hypothetical protein